MKFLTLIGALLTSCLFRGSEAIVGGELVKEGELPSTINVVRNNGLTHPSCGGALLEVNGKQFILTVARCCHEMMDMDTGILNPSTAIGGELDMQESSEHAQRVKLNRAIWHPDFDFTNQQLCILGMDGRFNYTDYVKPIQILKQGQNTTGDVVISGWGYYAYQNWTLDYKLRKVELPLLTHEECVKAFYGTGFVPERYMKCAWDTNNMGSGSCVGDRGGPAVSLDGNYLVGIIQMQPFACKGRDRRVPDVYLEVSQFINWIEMTSQDL